MKITIFRIQITSKGEKSTVFAVGAMIWPFGICWIFWCIILTIHILLSCATKIRKSNKITFFVNILKNKVLIKLCLTI